MHKAQTIPTSLLRRRSSFDSAIRTGSALGGGVGMSSGRADITGDRKLASLEECDRAGRLTPSRRQNPLRKNLQLPPQIHHPA